MIEIWKDFLNIIVFCFFVIFYVFILVIKNVFVVIVVVIVCGNCIYSCGFWIMVKKLFICVWLLVVILYLIGDCINVFVVKI